MNPGVFSVKNDRMVLMAMALAIVGGIVAYMNIGRLEDPEFTIKQALIITPYPGASPEEVAKEISNPIEIAPFTSRINTTRKPCRRSGMNCGARLRMFSPNCRWQRAGSPW
jgi:Cu/Ag efflux pump CusA